MAKNLIIVESPTKAKTIGKFLGKDYQILASKGHLRDLPKSRMGVDIDNGFEPQYINVRGKAKIINQLKKAASKADKVYLASDPDREGEAIAWHLAYLLDLDLEDKNRVVFNEITEDAIKKAVENPRKIDLSLVDAQQARRIMDRIVGYEISPILWKKVKGGLSAGRVQSVALKLICDREEEIDKFIPKEYWSISFDAEVDQVEFEGKFQGRLEKGKIKKIDIDNESQADEILNQLDKDKFKVVDKESKNRSRRPYPPFTTSTLQQEASRKLNFSTSKTMTVAQQLYEGVSLGKQGSVGLITYMRTDSTRLSKVIISESLDFIKDKYGNKYASKGRAYANKKANTQDAHEAVRVSSIYREPSKIKKHLTRDQYRLYDLIWRRTLASQMKNSRFESTRYDIDNNSQIFRASGSIMKFDGFSKIWPLKDNDVILPNMEVGQVFSAREIHKNQHFTKPKPRYTEASLVKKLEENGIGRPSTYSSIINNILSKKYVDFDKKSLYPTDLGKLVNDFLIEYFSNVINEEFTAEMEEHLDNIEEDKIEWQNLLEEFYKMLAPDLDNAKKNAKKVEIKQKKTGEKCPECGGDLVYRDGRNGKFIGCSNFPECKYTKPIIKKLGVKCPVDGGDIVEKITKRGKLFYGCNNYPDCDYATWDKPTGDVCPVCGDLMVHRKNRFMDKVICNNEDCPSNKE